jgi:isopentenyl-diphosphate Delta-isomerase
LLSSFIYKAQLEGGLVEHELDHVLLGMTSTHPIPDGSEVGEWRWISVEDLRAWLAAEPDAFTAWFPMVLKALKESRA